MLRFIYVYRQTISASGISVLLGFEVCCKTRGKFDFQVVSLYILVLVFEQQHFGALLFLLLFRQLQQSLLVLFHSFPDSFDGFLLNIEQLMSIFIIFRLNLHFQVFYFVFHILCRLSWNSLKVDLFLGGLYIYILILVCLYVIFDSVLSKGEQFLRQLLSWKIVDSNVNDFSYRPQLFTFTFLLFNYLQRFSQYLLPSLNYLHIFQQTAFLFCFTILLSLMCLFQMFNLQLALRSQNQIVQPTQTIIVGWSHFDTGSCAVQILMKRAQSLTLFIPFISLQRLINSLPPFIQQTVEFLRLIHYVIILFLFVLDFTHIIIKLIVHKRGLIH